MGFGRALAGPRHGALAFVALASAPLVWLALEGVARPASEPYPTGDYASIELYTRLAEHGAQRLGPESRFHIHHPGPVFFYAAAPVYALMGETPKGMEAAALVWNLAFLAALLRGAGRLAPNGGPVLAALLLGVLVQGRGLGFLLSPWNPHVAMLPFAVALLASARLATGDGRALPVLALAASAVVQNHVFWGLPLAFTGAASLLLCLWPAARRACRIPTGERGPKWGSLAATGAILALLWALPIVDELTGSYRNLHRMVSFRLNTEQPRPWGDTLAPTARGLSLAGEPVSSDGLTPAVQDGDGRRSLGISLTGSPSGVLIPVVLAIGGSLAARRRSAGAALALVAAVGLLSIPIAVRYAPGHALPPYQFQWGAMVSFAALLVAGAELLARSPRLSALASGALGASLLISMPVLLLTAAVWAQSTAGPVARDYRSPEIERITAEVKARVKEDVPGRRFLIRVARREDPAPVIGLILALDKAGLAFGVEPFGSFRIEGHFTPRGNEAAELLVGNLPPDPSARGVGVPGGLSVVWQVFGRSAPRVPVLQDESR